MHETIIKTLLTLVVGIMLNDQLAAQVDAPDFLCVKDDTLFFNSVTNNCGPFLSIDIFKSSSREGPYALLASVADPNAIWYVDNDPSPGFYYLQSNHDCVGQNVISSDTFSNQFQQFVTEIERVTVVGDNVEISWNENGSDQTIGYVIYRITPQGTLPIDTVFDGLSYLDVTASPNDRIESYYVLGLNACGGTNSFDDVPHSTILLTTEIDFCARHIQLNWNSYDAWDNGIDNNQIWLGIDGDPLAFEHRVSGQDTLAYITGVRDEAEYCISIIAAESGSNVESRSNVVCVQTDVLTPVDAIEVQNVTVNSDEAVEIDWFMNSNADITDLMLQRGNDALTFPDSFAINLPLISDMNQSLDQAAAVQTQPYFYRLQAIDQCDSAQLSNYISTVHLRLLSATEGENQIAWTPLNLTRRLVVGYEICRINNGVESLVGQTDIDQLFASDMIPIDQRDEIICYVVKASHTDAQGGDLRISRSNVLCIEQEVALYIPNAFVPTGNNSTFIPEFVNRPQAGYQMSIYNRWGGTVFETSNTAVGWDGTQNGTPCPAGVYIYLIQFPQPDGGQETFSGDVHLIR